MPSGAHDCPLIPTQIQTDPRPDPRMVVLDASRERDQESRSKAIGMIEGRIFVVVFTERKSATRVISARRANRVEERIYGNRQGKA